MPDPEQVTTGRSGATVVRQAGAYRKESATDDLLGEAGRLMWLRAHGIPAAEVLECGPGLLVTAEVPGRPADDEWPPAARDRVVDALAELTRALHALPVADCPFDRRLDVTVPAALAADVDLDDLDDERAGWSRDRLVAELLATRPADEDLVVCHGDLTTQNVLIDPATLTVSGVIDAGRLGVSDRWQDLAVMTRELADDLGEDAAARYLRGCGVEPDPAKQAFYRLLDEFF
ncbi:APH(3') family aminoglycoside O-phosphotransferase [Jiangella rhizosphaerae]|uniref:Aminoglycoside 3'-phosphotransferase n=1 Tax=Jiangella rhizosphaerae TaxID=2293569 RepID=A0A418KVH4_9ACTN|nr:APH(3') family aminoglycoside O-phosphotransferase [Jiangella rhizosphaerae]RIQ32128.1 aminoglycoside 3'-phosphotransferase [Jiangella rhizosphaerae]